MGDLQSAAARRVTTRQSLLRPGRLQTARARRRKCREEADQRARDLPQASPPALGLVRAPSSLALSPAGHFRRSEQVGSLGRGVGNRAAARRQRR